VEPEHEINLGSVARAMENFGAGELWLVRPRARRGFEAKMFAKHAWPLLQKAKKAGKLEDAVKGCSFVAGTTGVPRRYWKGIKNCITPRELAEKIKAGEKIAVIFGSEGRGLGKADLGKCGAVVSVPTSKKYPVMNLSHAVAVVLYELNSGNAAAGPLYLPAPKKKVARLEKMFKEIVSSAPAVRDKEKVARAFGQILSRGRPGDDEVQALFAAMSGIRKAMRPRPRPS